MKSYFLDKLLLEMGADCFEVHECSDVQFLFKIRRHLEIKSKEFHDFLGLNDSYYKSFIDHILTTFHKLTLINEIPVTQDHIVSNIELDVNSSFDQSYKRKILSSSVSVSNLILHSDRQEHYSTIVSFKLAGVSYSVYFTISQGDLETQCILSNGKYKRSYTLSELEDYFTLRALEGFVQNTAINIQDYMIDPQNIKKMSIEDIISILDVYKMQLI